FQQFGGTHRMETTKFQRVVARRLTESWATVPQVTHHENVDVTELVAYRNSFAGEVKISPLIFLVKALASALRAFPTFNSSLAPDGKHLIKKEYVHIGIAVDGPLGLLVPVLREVERKSVQELARELQELSQV